MPTLIESKKELQENFILLRKMNNDLINDLTDYSNKNNISNKIFMQAFTFSQSIALLKRVKIEAMTDENLENISKSQSIDSINEIAKNVDIQIRHHQEIRDIFNHYTSTN